jgi:hypothetical protein
VIFLSALAWGVSAIVIAVCVGLILRDRSAPNCVYCAALEDGYDTACGACLQRMNKQSSQRGSE